MKSEVSQSSWLYDLVAWFHARRKQVTWGAGTAIIIAAGASLVIYQQSQKEALASQALSEIRVPYSPAMPSPPGLVDALLKVAGDYSGTKAAARALLQAGGGLFVEEKYADSQKVFERLLKEYPESPWLGEASYGVAATLAAQRKLPEAVAKYEELRRRYPNDPVIDEAKLALGRLYEAQDRPADALKLYEELLKTNPYGGIGSEAGIRTEDLLAKHPELARTNPPAMSPITAMPASNAAVKVTSTRPGAAITNFSIRPTTSAAGATNRTGTPLLIKPNATPNKPEK